MERIEVSEYISKNNKKKNNKNGLLILILVIVSFCLGLGIMYLLRDNNTKIITKDRVTSEIKVTEEAMEDAIKKVYDSVVCIEVLDVNGNALSTGTGFIYDKDDKYGYVLTNAHVVTSGSVIQATLSNDKEVILKLLGSDDYTDLAVLQMDVKDVLKVASIGTSSNSNIGNTVFTVGSPMGATYAGTVTKGILSGKDRLIATSTSTSYSSETYIVKVLQTDAAISPGNSGGPLVNLAGDVIGITSLKLVNSSVEGMGFAIPIEDAMNYVDALEQGKKIQRPMMGVQILDLTNKTYLNRYDININTKLEYGIVLVKVNSGYPASDSGLKAGDIITQINGQEIKTVAEFKYELYKYNIGETVEITYYRNDKKNTSKVTLDKAME